MPGSIPAGKETWHAALGGLQARKQRRAAEQVAPLLAGARAELDYLAEVELMLQQMEGGAHLAALQEVQASAGGGSNATR